MNISAQQIPLTLNPTLDEWLRHLCAQPYFQRRVAIAKYRGNHSYPRYLYKYKALALVPQEELAKHLRDILVESRLWLSSPDDFNDPFDLQAHVVIEGTKQKRLNRFRALIKQDPTLKWKEKVALLRQYMARPNSFWQPIISAASAKARASIGVFSFAGDARNVLMWSHYGDYHRGICLQFEVARDPKTLFHALPVHYAEDYPVVNWIDNNEKELEISITHKFTQWSYEGEHRMIFPGRAHSYVSFAPGALVGAVLGCKVSNDALIVVRQLLDERSRRGLPSLQIYRAEKHGCKFALVLRKDFELSPTGERGPT